VNIGRHKFKARLCQTCNHPERERIEQELAIARCVQVVADHYEIGRRALSNHKKNHMTQEQIARMRLAVPEEVEVDIDALTRKGGQDAMIGLKRLNTELIEITARLDKAGDFVTAHKYRDLQLKVYREQMKVGALYPGLKQVTNNNVFVADLEAMARLAERVLSPWPDAKRAFAAGLLELQPPIDAEFREVA
jgi:hypothetical protein